MKSAKTITTVSAFFENKISALLSDNSYHIIPNGFDPEAIASAMQEPQTETALNIAFVGNILKWHPLEVVLNSIADFKSHNSESKLIVNFYGINIEDELKEMMRTQFSAIQDSIVIHPKTENADLLKELSKNSVMLLFNYYSYMGTKIYDYIGIHRKILLYFENII